MTLLNKIRLNGIIFIFSIQMMMAQDTLRLAFGSCNKADKDQSFWTVIADDRPDAWIWLGDIVYANTMRPKVINKKYKLLSKNPFYSKFSKSHPIYGVWDDNDYGEGDGGKHYKIKLASRNSLYRFLNIPKSNEAWRRDGAYQSYRLDKNGLSAKLILLDVRYFRDKLIDNPSNESRYLPNPQAEMLGETQWKWLENEIRKSNEDVILIGSGSQIIADEHPYEKWADYPTERARLMTLLEKYASKRIVLLSGDRHMAEVSAMAINHDVLVYEITSSGLTHTWTRGGSEPNGYRIRNMFPVKNYGTIEIVKSINKINVRANLKRIDGQVLDSYEIYAK